MFAAHQPLRMPFLQGLLAPRPLWILGGLGEERAAARSQEWLAERWQGRWGLQAAPSLLCEMSEEAERKRGRHFLASTLAPGRAPCGLGLR